jgi:hypothetical protein
MERVARGRLPWGEQSRRGFSVLVGTPRHSVPVGSFAAVVGERSVDFSKGHQVVFGRVKGKSIRLWRRTASQGALYQCKCHDLQHRQQEGDRQPPT